MKKLYFLLNSLILIIPFTAYTRLIEIIAEDGTNIHVSDLETVQEFFEKCRKDRHCRSNANLVLDFNNKLIKEGTAEAHKTLWAHSSWNSKKAIVATLQYPQQKNISHFLYKYAENTLIDVEAPNGKIKRCLLNDTPAYFFRKCRNSGECLDTAAMTLKFGNFEIEEDSQEANRPFYTFNTNSSFAQVKRR